MSNLRKFIGMSSNIQVRGILKDTFGRVHDYLRISLTERCNLRCRYCMPEDGIKLTNVENCLTLPEMIRLVDIFVVQCGIKKVRLTGGEPTVDSKLSPMLAHLNELRNQGIETVGLTTNGLTLKRSSASFKKLGELRISLLDREFSSGSRQLTSSAGLNTVNISLDTLNSAKFEQITRRKGLRLVLDGLDSAIATGFDKVKLNCVIMRGANDDELVDFALMARDYPIEVRFIEFMPFLGNKWDEKSLISYKEMHEKISSALPTLRPLIQRPNETSKLFQELDAAGTIGFITSMTDNFCGGCNRLRLTADGNLKVCLFGRSELSLRDLMRNGATDSEIVRATRTALNRKSKQHAGLHVLRRDVSRPMIKIGARLFHSSSTTFGADPDGFSHLNAGGKANMVNVGIKNKVRRVAIARGEIIVGSHVIEKIMANSMAKGDILTVSKIAGIFGAKMTSCIIPMCHHIALDHVQVDIWPNVDTGILVVEVRVEAEHKTGVEMESLTATSVTLLTIYDMCKSVSKDMKIANVRLLCKRKLTQCETM